MLETLFISNVALIEELQIAFHDGFSVLTGETGAGKSIIIEALNFVLGERASRELIKTGAQKAYVEATFTLSKEDPVLAVLAGEELETEEGTLTLSRELSAAGKNVCRANGTLISAGVLKEIGDALVDIHGQHAHQALLDPRRHLPMLDAFAGEAAATLKKQVAKAYSLATAAQKQLRGAVMDQQERERRMDLLSYQIKEMEEAELLDGEEEDLEEQRGVLQNAQAIMEALDESSEALSGEDQILSKLSGVVHALDRIASLHKDYGDVTERIRELYYNLEDASYTVRDLRNGFSYEPDALDKIEWRLEQIAGLKRKYGADIPEIKAYLDKCKTEYELLETSEERREELKAQYDMKLAEYRTCGEKLSALRQKTAQTLSQRLLPELAQLGMQHAAFSVSFAKKEGELPGSDGLDDVEFLLSTNKGEPVKPLSKVASGGELSRIMLAFKSVLAETDRISTMVFDEIDTGISGQVGTMVAMKMAKIARAHQVLCITHLPQIAAYASWQYLAYKETKGEGTRSTAVLLTSDQRAGEIARIMGSDPQDPIAMQHARQLIEAAKKTEET